MDLERGVRYAAMPFLRQRVPGIEMPLLRIVKRGAIVSGRRTVDTRCASSIDLRQGMLRVKPHLSFARSWGMEDILGRSGEGPTEGAAL